MELTDYRQQLDLLDEELVRLFKQRMWLSAQIGQYKAARDLPISDPAREQEKLHALCARVTPELQPYLTQLYDTIFSLSRQYQEVQA